jgi:hypothetical protein
VLTEVGEGRLWLHEPGKPLRPFTDVELVGANGVAYSPERGQLFVADFMGIWVLDRQGRLVGKLQASGGGYLGGLDGLYLVGDRLIGIQNIIAPERVISVQLGKRLAVGNPVVLASGQPALSGMTTGAVVGRRMAVLSRRDSGAAGGAAEDASQATLVWVGLDRPAAGSS